MRQPLLVALLCLAHLATSAGSNVPSWCREEDESCIREFPDDLSLFQRFVAPAASESSELLSVAPEHVVDPRLAQATPAELEESSVLARAYGLLQSYLPPRVMDSLSGLLDGEVPIEGASLAAHPLVPGNLTARAAAQHNLAQRSWSLGFSNLSAGKTRAVTRGNLTRLGHRSNLTAGLRPEINRTGTSAFWKTWVEELDAEEETENDSVKFPQGADIWNMSVNWTRVTVRHPAGVISHVYKRVPIWADVSYLSMDVLYLASLIAYPVVSVCSILLLTIFASIVMAQKDEPSEAVYVDSERDSCSRPVEDAGFAVKNLTQEAKRMFVCWALFCRSIPALMVFGMPVVLVALTYPYPQEVFVLLVVVSSVMVFSNGLYMVFFCPFTLAQMRKTMSSELKAASDAAKAKEEQEVIHWVILPNYKEDYDILCEAIDSVGKSAIASTQICVLLAMEAREERGQEKAEKLMSNYSGTFREIAMTFHPANLPNDPPGKASNMSWAFNWLCKHVEDSGADASKVVLTVSDADSDFHKCYFDSLSRSFAETAPDKKSITLWQSPIFHVKNYHRQPMPLIVGTMFTAMAEISVFSDPNSIRFPYSTYSLSMDLAKHVGGWDPEWIAEDWHMGIKCFMLTLGESQVQPILLPTVNYTPEDDSWFGTCMARWAQAKRHALGFSDMAYYFTMLPLIFTQLSKPRKDGKDLRDFWKLFFSGLCYIVRLVNTHVIVGIMTLYMAISFMLKNIMIIFLQDGRNVGELFDRSKGACTMFMCASVITVAMTTGCFQVVYCTLAERMNPAKAPYKKMFDWPIAHWMYTLTACISYAMVYAVGLGVAVWIAAVKVLCLKSFAYEVAAKPTATSHL